MPDNGFPLRSRVVERRFDNGLVALVCEDRRAPVAAIVTHVKAGYFDEADDVVGISHVLEHMFFKGTARRGPGDMARETKSLGGYLNAGTIYEKTSYYTVVPSAGIETALDIQADALQNSAIDAAELERELRVIIQEAKRKLDSPPAVARETLYETMFDRHRIRRWRIGTEAGLERLTRDDVVDFYRSYYRAPNIVLCVAGDVDADTILPLIERHYGGIPGDPVPSDRGPAESPRSGFRFREIDGDIAQTYLEWGWQTPGPLADETPLLDLFSMALGQGRAARLYRSVREHGLVTHIGAWNHTPGTLGVFGIGAVSVPGDAVPALDAIHATLRDALDRGIGSAELDRARNILEAGLVRRFEMVEGQATLLAEWQAQGDWRLFGQYWDRLMAATAEEVNSAAREYLAPDRATVLVYRPGTAPSVTWTLDDPPVVQPAPPPPPAVSPMLRAGAHTVSTDAVEDGVHTYSGPGVRVLVFPRRDVPLVSMSVAWPGGAAAEVADCAGITALMASASLKGTTARTAARIAEDIEFLGGSVAPGVSSDSLEWALTLPSRHFDAGLDLLADVILDATFPPDEVDRERKATLSGLKLLRDDMMRYPHHLFYEAAFPGDAYGLTIEATESAIASIQASALGSWHARVALSRDRTAIVVGDVDPDEAALAVIARFAADVESVPGEPEPAQWPDGPRQRIESRDTAQSAFCIGFRGPDRNHPDSESLRVLAAAVGGLGGRLFEELRSRRSLAYTVSARPVSRLRAGAFIGYIATSPEREREARDVLIAELMRLTVETLPADEVERAKRYLTGALQIQRQTNRARQAELAGAVLLGGGLHEIRTREERIAETTATTIRDAAARWFDSDRVVEGIVRGSGRSR